MPSGAHARSGPAPDPNSLRSQAKGLTQVTLPAAGYDGDVPDWPLNGQLEREAEVWTETWKTPQATQWIDQPWRWLGIGMYVRTFVRCEMPTAKAADINALRMLADEIGLSQPGLRLNGWKIGPKTDSFHGRETATDPVAGNVVNFRERASRVAGDA